MKEKKSSVFSLFQIALHHSFFPVIIYVLMNILNGVLASAMIIVTSRFINGVINSVSNSTQKNLILIDIILIILIYTYRRLVPVVGSLCVTKISTDLKSRFRIKLIKKQAKLKYDVIENTDTSDLISRIFNNIDNNLLGVVAGTADFCCVLFQVLGIIAILICHIWWLGVLMIICIIPFIYISCKGGIAIYQSDQEVTYLTRRMYYLSEILSNRDAAAERILFRYTDFINGIFEKTHIERTNKNLKVITKWSLQEKMGSILIYSYTIILIFALLTPVKSGDMSIGLYISIIGGMLSLVNIFTNVIKMLLNNFAGYQEFSKDYQKFTELPESEYDYTNEQKEKISFESLELRNVSFVYPGTEKYVLKNINFVFEKGKQYSLVGKNGCGKTTLVKLLTGLYDVTQGEILINGQNLKEFKKERIANLFSIIYQDAARYPLSLKENITLGKGDDIERVLKRAHLEEDVNRLPEGTESVLGKLYDNGVDLSCGQWQKIAIARALYRNEQFYILDEPNASLSPKAESSLYTEFSNIIKDKTSIMISHRLGSTKYADQILLIDEGEIAEVGTHEELMEKNGIYSEMFTKQRKWYEDEE